METRGRPKKDDSDKIKYQLVAIWETDNIKINKKIDMINRHRKSMDMPKIKKAEIFSRMIQDYCDKPDIMYL